MNKIFENNYGLIQSSTSTNTNFLFLTGAAYVTVVVGVDPLPSAAAQQQHKMTALPTMYNPTWKRVSQGPHSDLTTQSLQQEDQVVQQLQFVSSQEYFSPHSYAQDLLPTTENATIKQTTPPSKTQQHRPATNSTILCFLFSSSSIAPTTKITINNSLIIGNKKDLQKMRRTNYNLIRYSLNVGHNNCGTSGYIVIIVMNQEDKRTYADQLQKNLTKSCYLKCSKNNKSGPGCFEACYEKYIKSINVTSRTIREVAYQKNSVIGYKGYPEHSIQSLLNITRTLVDTLDYAPFGIQHQSRA